DGREHEKRLEDDLSRRVSPVMDGRSQLRTTAAWLVLWLIGCPVLASAQAPGQVWLAGTATWLTNDRLQIRAQFEAKDQFIVPDNQPTFLSTETTPRVLYVVAPWIDVLGEIAFETKDQSNNDDSTTVTPRVGVQLHILSRLL